MKINLWVIAVILTLIVGYVVFDTYGDSEFLSLSGTGYTVTSITTSPNIITSNTNIANVDYLINTVFNGGGQSVTAKIYPSDIAGETGYSSDYAFTIKATAIDETVTYPILNTGNRVYKYSLVEQSGTCPTSASYDISVVRYFVVVDHICIYKTLDAVVGELDNPTVKNSAQITVSSSESSSESYTKTIDTTTSQSVYFNDNSGNRLVTASWVGSLVTGNSYPSPSKYVATYAVDSSTWSHKGNWWISYDDEYDDYKEVSSTADSNFNRWESEFSLTSNVDEAIDLMQEQVDDVNAARNTLVGGTSVTIGTAQTYVDRDDEDDGKVQITLDNQINNMDVVFRVAADWIGINIPSGEPEILSVNCPEFAAGDSSGYCEIKVKNTGDGDGYFVGSMLSCGSFTQKTSSSPALFSSGETDYLTVYIDSGTLASATTSTCTFKVYDYNDPANYDTASGTISMTDAKSCVPGQIRKDNRVLYQCNDAGTGEDLLLSCATGETLLTCDDTDESCTEGYYCEEGGTGSSIWDALKDLAALFTGDGDASFEDIITAIVALIVLGVFLYIFGPLILPLLNVLKIVIKWIAKLLNKIVK